MGLLCAAIGHERDGKRAWHDNLDWRSNCIRCGRAMLRDTETQKWRLFDPIADFALERRGKPDHSQEDVGKSLASWRK